MNNTTTARIRSYVLRQGRMTRNQQRAYHELVKIHSIPFEGKPVHWAAYFGREAPLVCEIGFGMGRSLVQMAQHHPEMDFIGIEVHGPGVGSCLHALREAAVTNLKIIQHDAMDVLLQGFEPGSLSRLHLFFPDPWPKKRHNKRRIVQKPFLDASASVLCAGGTLHMATDWAPYASWMLEHAEAHEAFTNQAGEGVFSEPGEGRFLTKFEQRGQRLGHRIFDLKLSVA
jgi:tRNA (guanine-N7-)-methyltransferase